MISTKMTLLGKIFMALFFFAAGFGACAVTFQKEIFKNEGVSNKTEVRIGNIKVKDGSTVTLDGENSSHQSQEKDNKTKDKNKPWFKFW